MKVSVVIPSLNQASFLRDAIDSVLVQEGPFDLEVVVVDGGSTDGSVELLGSINDDRLTWTSEADKGQADAVNKGIARSTGDVIGWLNSDDRYTPGALDSIAETFRNDSDIDWVVGRCRIINEAGHPIRHAVTRYKDRRLQGYRYRGLLRENFISQMGVFWQRRFGDAVGPLDITLEYTMDYDLWLRMGRRCDPLVLDQVVGEFRLHRSSKSGRVDRRQFDEQYEVACRHLEAGDHFGRLWHRLNVEKIVWSYRLMRLLGL